MVGWLTRSPKESPLIVVKSMEEKLTPMSICPLPMVSARSPMIGPSTRVCRSKVSVFGLKAEVTLELADATG